MKNKRIRIKMMEYNMKMWQLAKLMKVSEMTVYRRFREELPKEEQNRIIDLIENARGEINE